MKRGTFSRRTLHRDRPTVQFHQLSHNGESQPQPLRADFRDPVSLEEGLKKAGLSFPGDPRTGIGDCEEDVTRRSGRSSNQDASFLWRKFMGVVDEIGDDLVEAVLVAPGGQMVFCKFDRQVLGLGLGEWQQFLRDILKEFGQ